MEIHNLLDVKSRVELREWLIKNHRTEKECWVIVKRGKPTDDTTFWYIDAVEEALCFGWIDKNSRRSDSPETLSQKTTKQLVGTEQGKMPQNGTHGTDDRCRKSRSAGYVA